MLIFVRNYSLSYLLNDVYMIKLIQNQQRSVNMKNVSTFSYIPTDLKKLPTRPIESNKGTFGRVLCVCGSYGMAGAAYFAAKSALRVGAGLVEILTVRENVPVLQTLLPEAIVTAYDSEMPDVDVIKFSLSKATAIVCGCGLGVSRASRTVLSCVLRNTTVPTVLDADALNLISKNPSLIKYACGKILTPHPVEMSRLINVSVEEILSDNIQICQSFAQKHSLVCVLKTHKTAVSDGSEKVYINTTGNSGMATGGSGDVLAGIIGGILAQAKNGDLSLLDSAALGVYIHGLAGDAAAAKLGEYSLIASDIIDALPTVTKR